MKTVFVGLSGGVDSAVSAALLSAKGGSAFGGKQKYNVVGAFIKIWQPEFLECSWRQDRLDAMRVCAALDIPFREIDLSDEYKNEVVENMLGDYTKGITPNPDVLCNRSIKFGHFAKWAFENGADLIATGHYARATQEPLQPRGVLGKLTKDSPWYLLRGKDPNKDQSYFLHRLNQKDLSRTMFPIGELVKSDVRALAKKFNLPVAQKYDSQGLCFVGDVSMKEFLARFITLERGDVVDLHGAVVGMHDGAALYTIGERHGFGSSGESAQYVVAIDVTKNIVHVSSKREDAARKNTELSDVSWIAEIPDFPISVEAQARYREKPFSATIISESRFDLEGFQGRTLIRARFDDARIAAPGQSLVMYHGDVCLGGGIINS